MAADALAPYVARTSAAMVLTVYDKQDLVFHGEGFLWHTPTGNAPTTSEWSTILLPTKLQLILEIWWYIVIFPKKKCNTYRVKILPVFCLGNKSPVCSSFRRMRWAPSVARLRSRTLELGWWVVLIIVMSHGCHGVSNYWQHDCLFNSLFMLTSKKISKPALLAFCEVDGMSKMVQVMVWHNQAISHYLNLYCPRSPMPYR